MFLCLYCVYYFRFADGIMCKKGRKYIMRAPMKIAIIGCGRFCKFFVPLFKAHPVVEKVFVCDLKKTGRKNMPPVSVWTVLRVLRQRFRPTKSMPLLFLRKGLRTVKW